VIRFRDRTRSGSEERTAEPSTEGPTAHHSPGLRTALSGLAGDLPGRVLDLGSSVAANIAFYSRFARHIQIVDLLRVMKGEAGEGLTVGPALDWNLAGDDASYDLVLLWDIINYLDREQAVTLIARLHAASRPDARFFLMIYVGSEMPAVPPSFEIVADDRVSYRPAASGTIPPARLEPAEVERLLAGFRIEGSFILRHGVREFVAVRI